MINIYADHGEHGNFLSMSLNVLEGNFDLKNNKSGVTFDFWTGRLPHYRDAKNPNKAGPMPSEKNVLRWGIDVDYKYNHKMPGTEDIISEEKQQAIWLIKDKPLLWAYNSCTRAVIHWKEDYYTYKKGIDISEFENYPWRWCDGCHIFLNSDYGNITKKPDGTSNKKSLRRWMTQTVWHPYHHTRKTPDSAVGWKISSFFNKQAFIENAKTVESAFGKTYDYSKIDDLYTAFHNTLSYDYEMVHTRPTNLLQTYQSLDADYKATFVTE